MAGNAQTPHGTVPRSPVTMRSSGDNPQADIINRVDRGELPPREEIEAAFPNASDQRAIFEQVARRHAGRADTTPLPVPVRERRLTGLSTREYPSGIEPPMVEVPAQPTGKTRALREGVVPDTPIPVSIRLPAGFIANEASRDNYVAHRLSQEHGGANIETRRREGRLEYLNPETRRWTDASGFGLNPSDVAASMGYIPPIFGELVGSAVGHGLFPGVGGIAGGAGIGATIGEAGRAIVGTLILSQAGLDPTRAQDMALDIGGEGLFAASATLGFYGLARLANRIHFGPRAISPEEIHSITSNEDFIDAAEVVRQLRDRGYDFRPTTAQMSGIQKFLDIEATVASGGSGGSFTAAHRLRQSHWDNSATLRAFFDNFSPPSANSLSARDIGADILQWNRRTVERSVLSPREYTRRVQQELLEAGNDIPAFNRPLVGRAVRGEAQIEGPDGEVVQQATGLHLARQQADDRSREAWGLVNALSHTDPQTGLSRVKIPRSPIMDEVVALLRAEADRALIPGQGAGKDRLVGRLATRDEDMITILGADGAPLSTFHRNALEYDFHDINAALSYLRRQGRASARGIDPDLPSGRDITRLKAGLLEARDSFLAATNPNLLVAVREAERATRYAHTTFSRGVAGDLLREVDGVYALNDMDVANRIFSPGNLEEVATIARHLSVDTEATRQVRASMVAFYRSKAITTRDVPGVGRTEVISREGHDRFMREYGESIRPFISPDEARRMDELGNLAEVVEQADRHLAAREATFKASLSGRLDRMNSESILDVLFDTSPRRAGGSGFSIDDAERLSRWMGNNNPELLARVQESVQDEIRRRITVDGHLDISRLDAMISATRDDAGGSLRGKLQAVMGQRYMDDLRLIRDALRMQNRGGTPIPMEGPSESLVGIARRIAIPPLTQRGRAATAIQQKFRRFGQDALAEIVSNPEQLRAFVSSMHAQIGSERAGAIMAATGLDLVYENGGLDMLPNISPRSP